MIFLAFFNKYTIALNIYYLRNRKIEIVYVEIFLHFSLSSFKLSIKLEITKFQQMKDFLINKIMDFTCFCFDSVLNFRGKNIKFLSIA